MDNEQDRENTDIVPWEIEPDPADTPDARHDAFNGARKRAFLKALAKGGCIADAARKAGVTPPTVYNHQHSDPEFAQHIQLALGMAATNVELAAWERGVVGIEEEVIHYGKVVGTRRKRSDSILRLLLQGADRKKYGPRPGFSRKRLLKHERKQIERDVRAEIAALEPDVEEVRRSILAKIDAISRHEDAKRLATGWTRLDGDIWIPPGWARIEDGLSAPSEPAPAVPDVGDSV